MTDVHDKDQVWVTAAGNKESALGALVLARCLRKFDARRRRKLVIFVTVDVSLDIITILQNEFDCLLQIEVKDGTEWETMAKISCWNLPHLTGIFLPCDCFVVEAALRGHHNDYDIFDQVNLPDGAFRFERCLRTYRQIMSMDTGSVKDHLLALIRNGHNHDKRTNNEGTTGASIVRLSEFTPWQLVTSRRFDLLETQTNMFKKWSELFTDEIQPKLANENHEEMNFIVLPICTDSNEKLEEILAKLKFGQNDNFNYTKSGSHRAFLFGFDQTCILNQLSTRRFPQGVAPKSSPKVAFLFTGQGSQYHQMARNMYEHFPAFASTLNKCRTLLQSQLNFDLFDVLWNDGIDYQTAIDKTIYSQTSIFCVEVSLCALWASFGIQPDYVFGHSVGEFAAAVCSGVMTFEDALTLVGQRSKLIQSYLQRGGMLAVKASLVTVEELLKHKSLMGQPATDNGHTFWLDIAVVNSPDEVVLAGRPESIDKFTKLCERLKITCHRLGATHAFHSRDMDEIKNMYSGICSTVKLKTPNGPKNCKFVSGSSGKIVRDELISVDYWLNHARRWVNFPEGIKTLVDQEKCDIFVEIGAHPVLLPLAMSNVGIKASKDNVWLPSMRKNEDNWVTMMTALGHLFVRGLPVDFSSLGENFNNNSSSISGQESKDQSESSNNVDHIPVFKETWDERDSIFANRICMKKSVPNLQKTDLIMATFLDELRRKNASEERIFLDGERVCLYYMLKGLRDVGWNPKPGDVVSPRDFVVDFELSMRYELLVQRYFIILTEQGWLSAPEDYSDEWTVQMKGISNIIESMKPEVDKILLNWETNDINPPVMTLAKQVSAKLPAYLRGQEDILAVMFPKEEANPGAVSAEDTYHSSPLCVTGNDAICAFLDTILYNFESKNDKLRILEVGAGTGATTARILQTLENHPSKIPFLYTFSDIGPAFLPKAAEKFARYKSSMEFRVLDLEKDPKDSHYAPNMFDIVVASNVLHATQNLKETAQNVRHLMRDSGLFIILETLHPVNCFDLPFGLIEGYWRFRDFDLRPTHTLINGDQWTKLLQSYDFPSVSVYPTFLSASGVIVAQASENSKNNSMSAIYNPPYSPSKWMLLGRNDGPLTSSLKEYFTCTFAKTNLFFCNLSSESDKNFSEFQEDGDEGFQGVVFVWNPSQKDDLLEHALQEVKFLQKIMTAATTVVKPKQQGGRFFFVVPLGTLLAEMVKDTVKRLITSENLRATCIEMAAGGKGRESQNEVPAHVFSRTLQIAEDVSSEFWREEYETNVRYLQVSRKREVRRLNRSTALHPVIKQSETVFNEGKSYLVIGNELSSSFLTLLTSFMRKWGAGNTISIVNYSGCKIWYDDNDNEELRIQADLSDMSTCTQVLDEIEHRNNFPIGGIFILDVLHSDKVHEKPKLAGCLQSAWNLHCLTAKNKHVEYFILLNSISEEFGIGNVYQSVEFNAGSLMEYRKGLQIPSITISFPPWTQSDNSSLLPEDESSCCVPFALNTESFNVILNLMKSGSGSRFVLGDINFELLRNNYTHMPSLFEYIVGENLGILALGTILPKEHEFWEQIESKKSQSENIQEYIYSLLENFIRVVLKYPSDLEIEGHLNFTDLGMDSLMTVDMKNEIQAMLGDKMILHPAVHMDFSSVTELSTHLASLIKQ